MTQQTEQICFRYDGSEEAKKALKWVNEENETSFVDIKNKYYTNDGNCYNNILRTYRLVTPAEFLRLVSEPQWKVGDECESVLSRDRGIIKAIVGNEAWVRFGCFGEEYNQIIDLKHILPIRKSVREELTAMLWGGYDAGAKADEILSKFNVTPKH